MPWVPVEIAPASDWSASLDALQAQGRHLDAMRVRGFPFSAEVEDFIAAHDEVFVVEQNRDAQLRLLIMNECGVDPAKLTALLHFDGTPITARFIAGAIGDVMAVKQGARVTEAAE